MPIIIIINFLSKHIGLPEGHHCQLCVHEKAAAPVDVLAAITVPSSLTSTAVNFVFLLIVVVVEQVCRGNLGGRDGDGREDILGIVKDGIGEWGRVRGWMGRLGRDDSRL